jgi:hypothetical protein
MNAPSLTGFLEITGAKYRLFDLGTHLKKVPESTLLALDEGQPYPHPHLGFGWLVIFLWNTEETAQNSLWFLKLPLDEQGILSAGVHSDLVRRLYSALQESDEKERARLLTEHPYQFTPDHEKMAALHAKATQLLALPPSDFHESADDFFKNPNSSFQWQQLGIQGIADMVCRLKDPDFTTINKRLLELDVAPLIGLLQQLEHRPLPTSTIETLVQLIEVHNDQPAVVSNCLRAAAQSPAAKLLDVLIEEKLNSDSLPLDFVLIVLTRYTRLLNDNNFSILVLTRLAQLADADGFARVMTNLAMQPGMQGIVMKTLSSKNLTTQLANALSVLIAQQRHGKRNEQ